MVASYWSDFGGENRGLSLVERTENGTLEGSGILDLLEQEKLLKDRKYNFNGQLIYHSIC